MQQPFSQQLATWYEQEPGKTILKLELTELKAQLPQLFGYYLLQIGYKLGPEILQDCPIHNQFYLDSTLETEPSLQTTFTRLPIKPESIDAVVLMHTLEFAENPHKLLQEIYNALIPGGSLLIFGFNPHSLMGITRLWHNKATIPWHGKFISPWHLRKLLTKTKFSVGDYKTFFFRPLLQNHNNLKKLMFLETIGQFFCSYFGASYMFCCKKTCYGVNVTMPENNAKEFIPVSTPVTRATRFAKIDE